MAVVDAAAVTLPVILASASPARLGLLRAAGIDPVVRVSAVDEDALTAAFPGDPAALVQHLADAKADAVVAGWEPVRRRTVLIAADSLFRVGDRVLGKPGSAAVARERLAGLSGGTGDLLTGHAVRVLHPDGAVAATGALAATTVRFAEFTPAELDAYVATGEPVNVAGGFTLDGIAAPFIAGIDGDPSNVIGLSLPLLRRLVADLGVFWPDLWRQPH